MMVFLVMSELLFECYQVPSVSYGIDALYNLYHSLGNKNFIVSLYCSLSLSLSLPPGGCVSDALVINCGYQTTHICPVLDGLFQPDHSKRLANT